MKKILSLLIAAFLMAFVMAACTPPEEEPSTPGTNPGIYTPKVMPND